MAARSPKLPQRRPSLISVPAYDYRVYHLTLAERLVYGLLALTVGGAIGYLFFGGLATDADGHATVATYVLNGIAVGVPAIFATRTFLRVRTEQIRATKVRTLETQFRDMLDSLSVSLASGGTVIQGFNAARSDMERQYAADAPIVQELNLIIAGFHNSIRVEDMLTDLGERSGSDDVASFANVFRIAYLRGADMKQAVQNTHVVISEKMAISAEIETSLVAGKNESFIMVAIPIVLVGILKSGGGGFADALRTPVGVMSTMAAVALFVAAYVMARKIMSIKF
ncbi:hypothetical protein IGS67_04630 [Flavimobilis sp. GY10621]|uniref:Tight adherence protein B n=1 Tax=Flavimobilis rhizosphaerae TaxID=2775421 RepID=A0ABR9DNU1_9MICO|nr:hypothetical protein [Flavimobilis rhizosphaerae]MBD9698780.1 hypothetical protein [Flavimobilis rhizosphaerae]